MNKYEATQKISDDRFWKEKPSMDEIQDCIDSGADLTQLVRTEYGYTYPLAYYAAQYLPEAIPVLVKHGMDINQTCQEGTAVELASYCSCIKPLGMKYLLENGADIHRTANTQMGCSDPKGQAILDQMAAATGFMLPSYTDVTCVGWALIEGASMDDDPGDICAEEQRQKMALLFEAGIHPDAPAHDGKPPIFHTTLCGYKKATQVILDHGGHIDARSMKGDTALTSLGKIIARDFKMQWVKEGNVPMTDDEKNESLARQYLNHLNLVLSKGASVNLPDADGYTFENGPASRIPFIAQIIKIYHAQGKEGVNQWVNKWNKIWAKEAHDLWYTAYQKNKIQEADRRNEIAHKMRLALRKKSDEGKQEALKIARHFHVYQGNDSHEEWRIKSDRKLRPTALNLGR